MIGQLAERPVTYPTQSFLRFVTFVARNLYAGATGTTTYFSPVLSRAAPILMAPTFFPLGTYGTTLATYILEPLEPSGTLCICGVCGFCGLVCKTLLAGTIGSFGTLSLFTPLLLGHHSFQCIIGGV